MLNIGLRTHTHKITGKYKQKIGYIHDSKNIAHNTRKSHM